MTWLGLALILSATCEHPALSTLPADRHALLCELMAQEETSLGPALSTLPPVYERPGFERARERSSGIWEAFVTRLRHWFEGLIMSSAAQTYSVITRVVVLVLALVISGGLLLRFMLRRRQVPKAVSEKRETVGELKLDDPATHLGRAEALLTQDSREAIREGLLCLLSTLERLRFAKPNRVKTNQELAHGLSERGAPAELIASVTPLLAWFDSAFYSLEPVPSAEAKRFVDDVRRVTVREA